VEMSVPVRWLVERRELGLTVLAGRDALDRRITWAHSIELADPVRWLGGGELLLTTGLRLPRSAADRRDYLARLDAAGVAAVGFGVGLSFQRVPDVLVDAAEQLRMPLIEVPLPTPFVAVTRAVSQRLAELEYEGVAAAARGQLAMTRAALRGGPGAVVRQLAAITGGGVALFGPNGGEPVAAQGLRGDHTARIAEVLSARPADGIASAGPDGSVIGQVVRVGRRVHGRLVLVTGTATTPADRLLLGHAVSLVALDRERPRRARDELNRLGTTLCELLLDGAADRSAPSSPEMSVPAGSVKTGGPPGRMNGTFVFEGAELCVVVVLDVDPRRALTEVDRVLAEHGLPLLGTVRDGHAVVLVPAGVAVEVGGHAGRSAPCETPEVSAALRQAVIAARVARSRGVPLVHFDSLAGHVLAAAPGTSAVLADLARVRLRPLDGTDLVATLRVFLEHNGHAESTSAALGVHRHTLRARLDRVRALLDVDLDDAYVRAELLLAMTQTSAATASASTDSPSASRSSEMDSGGRKRSTLP
jgi:PucR family transcriptional regulator, purine catabolism regulatory protein